MTRQPEHVVFSSSVVFVFLIFTTLGKNNIYERPMSLECKTTARGTSVASDL